MNDLFGSKDKGSDYSAKDIEVLRGWNRSDSAFRAASGWEPRVSLEWFRPRLAGYL